MRNCQKGAGVGFCLWEIVRVGKISGQRSVEQIRKAAMPPERFAGLWAKGIRSEMNEAKMK
jgi:hypothetical protein